MADEITPHKGRSSLPAALVIVGVSFLLFNPGWLEWVASWLWAALFFAAGALFLSHYRRNSRAWWALLPAFGLLALGAAALGSGAASGPLLLGFLGAGFTAVYRAERRRWWALLPVGVLWTLALVAWLGETRPGFEVGWVFFLGLAATPPLAACSRCPAPSGSAGRSIRPSAPWPWPCSRSSRGGVGARCSPFC